MTTVQTGLLLCTSLLLFACGGGSSGGDDDNGGEASPPILSDDTTPPGETPPGDAPPVGTVADEDPDVALPADAVTAAYAMRVESFWFIEEYPQGFPDNAHLSFIGGATHNASVSFWEPGTVVSNGVEDTAESGRIDIFLTEDVMPAIENGTADSAIDHRDFIISSPETFEIGLENEMTYELEMNREWPRVSLVTMLGPSPDWFVGIDGLPLHEDGAWHDEVVVDLPLYDAGTKSSVEPIMGGPDTRPPEPVTLIGYDVASGTYQPTDTPQNIARVTFTRLR